MIACEDCGDCHAGRGLQQRVVAAGVGQGACDRAALCWVRSAPCVAAMHSSWMPGVPGRPCLAAVCCLCQEGLDQLVGQALQQRCAVGALWEVVYCCHWRCAPDAE